MGLPGTRNTGEVVNTYHHLGMFMKISTSGWGEGGGGVFMTALPVGVVISMTYCYAVYFNIGVYVLLSLWVG